MTTLTPTMPTQPAKPKKPKKKAAPRRADTADRYDLYQQSVQEPDHEVAFFDRVYRELTGKTPAVLREDFCGTFAVCCEWVRAGTNRRAIGVDLDPEPLAWGREHNLAALRPAQRKRVELREADVRASAGAEADVLAAQNFSFFCFTRRDDLRAYFAAARSHLRPGGVMVLDMMGGSECYEEGREDVRKIGKGKAAFKYVWEQARFDPITHACEFHISFRFKDGSRLERAFSYQWRFWTIPEVRELLAEAGFARSTVYWEGTDPETEEGDGDWQPAESAPSDPSWIAYIVAQR